MAGGLELARLADVCVSGEKMAAPVSVSGSCGNKETGKVGEGQRVWAGAERGGGGKDDDEDDKKSDVPIITTSEPPSSVSFWIYAHTYQHKQAHVSASHRPRVIHPAERQANVYKDIYPHTSSKSQTLLPAGCCEYHLAPALADAVRVCAGEIRLGADRAVALLLWCSSLSPVAAAAAAPDRTVAFCRKARRAGLVAARQDAMLRNGETSQGVRGGEIDRRERAIGVASDGWWTALLRKFDRRNRTGDRRSLGGPLI